MNDHILITMPSDPHEFFIAMAVAQSYVYEYTQEVHRGMRSKYFQFTYRMEEKYSKYEAPLKVAANNQPIYDYTGWTGLARSEFNCFIDFDFTIAKDLAIRSGTHITKAFGVMIGCTPRKQPIFPPPTCTEGKGILICDWWNQEHRKLKISDRNVSLVDVLDTYNPLDLEVETAEAVIGPASACTLMAAAYNRKLLEIFPDEESYMLFNNDGITDYQAIIGEPITADIVATTWRDMESPCQIDFGYAMK